MARCVVFDLDGTLTDSLPDLAAALNRSLGGHGQPPLPLDQVRPMVGDGIRALYERGYAARGLMLTEADLAAGTADYTAHATVETVLYPGAMDAVQALAAAGWRIAVCTNKPEAPARVLLAHVGLLPLLAAVGGGDSFAMRKPDPEHVRLTLAAAGGETETAIMVGDHHNDIAAGHGAGAATIFAAWGYGTPEMGTRADAVAERFADVPELCRRFLKVVTL
ncbi:HAD-IA family hydrolase [Acidisoma cladoniae]|jgi:phosphoglycolate phosphatase|uniref:HAD-IA family hydrolase n=1 Tax=Acidisoma cladoniae TaxID=3040935 RepID=UPI00254F0E56|nr:HAD-IA family hydrolase [Acidisoma sp. PAMC 29798]